MGYFRDMPFDGRMENGHYSDRGRGWPRRGHGSGGSFRGERMTGPVRRGPLMVNARPSPYSSGKSIRKVNSFPWKHDLLEDSIRAAGIPEFEIGAKLHVSNLNQGVTNEDIRQLFSEFGELKRYAIHYDKNGRPSGSAEVVYTRRSYAFAALKRYNNVQLDGKPMKIEILGDRSEMPVSARSEMPVSARVNVTGLNGHRRRTVVMPGFGQTGFHAVNRGPGPKMRGGMTSRGRTQGHGRGQGGSSRGRSRAKKAGTKISADDLDKELDNYHAEAMQI